MLYVRKWIPAAVALVALAASAASVRAQMPTRDVEREMAQEPEHEMFMTPLGGGWTLMGMAQLYPMVTAVRPSDGEALEETELYLTQPLTMLNVESPGSRFVLRTTVDFEGVTMEDGELTLGGWGEGFIDKRHPHTLLHEAMLSVNFWDAFGGSASISAGKGFAPYGTDDPMSRPVLKYPTNHHLSQILERWLVSGAFVRSGWSIEAGVFGGSEPEGPYDLSNIESFGDSWSARIAKRLGGHDMPTMAPWELSASYGSVLESHEGVEERSSLYNVALRHERAYAFGEMYGLVEASRSDPENRDGFFSLAAEASLRRGPHEPYYRIEYATRPEYEREGPPGTEDFFRYDHDSDPIGATRWLINTLGYGYRLTDLPVSARPFVEVQYARVDEERGNISPEALFGTESAWTFSAGFRIFLGGGPMRMGAYGVLDDMTAMHRMMPLSMPMEEPGMHEGH